MEPSNENSLHSTFGNMIISKESARYNKED